MKNTIQPETPKFHRQRARLSQDALAQKSRVGKKTISRIENGKGNNIRANTINRLAAALQIKPEDLAMPPQEGSHFGATNRKFRTYIDTDVALAFAIVEHRYNVSYQSLVEMAPLFFTLLAEGSLAWRKEQLSQIEKAADIVMEWGRTGGHPAYCEGSAEIEDFGIPEEKDSIDKIDLFGQQFGGRSDELKIDDAKDERIEWITEKIPDDERRKLEEQERLWADLLTN